MDLSRVQGIVEALCSRRIYNHHVSPQEVADELGVSRMTFVRACARAGAPGLLSSALERAAQKSKAIVCGRR